MDEETYDPHAILTEMSVEITVGEFHRIHDIALAAETKVEAGGLDKLQTSELVSILQDLEAGQRLTKAETGPDQMYAHSYYDAIDEVKKEICKRN